MGTDLLGSWRPCPCVLPTLYCIESRPNLELASGNCESYITKNRGACALTRAGGSLSTIKLKSACREPDLSLSGFDPVPLSKIGTHLLASLLSTYTSSRLSGLMRTGGKHTLQRPKAWVAKEKIGTLLLASEMPVPIPRSRTVEACPSGSRPALSRNGAS